VAAHSVRVARVTTESLSRLGNALQLSVPATAAVFFGAIASKATALSGTGMRDIDSMKGTDQGRNDRRSSKEFFKRLAGIVSHYSCDVAR
jgi:hypothetical protein